MDIFWNGPHDWPLLRQRSSLDALSGVYLWTLKGEMGYIATGCGLTSRSVRRRVGEHRREFLSGSYTVLDVESAKRGIRKEIWHGLWARHNSDDRKAQFALREEELRAAARLQMAETKIFVAEVSDSRLRQRMEASVMAALYAAPEPYCDLPDRGMFLAGRSSDEVPITVANLSECIIYNLPQSMEI